MEGIRVLVRKVHNHQANLITSVMTQVEVLECTLNAEARRKLEHVFKRKNVAWISTDPPIANLAHDLRNYYKTQQQIDRLPTLTQADAVHLATAILYKADVMYTFDEHDKPKRRRALIPLSGQVAGRYNLPISKPMATQLDLLDEYEEKQKHSRIKNT